MQTTLEEQLPLEIPNTSVNKTIMASRLSKIFCFVSAIRSIDLRDTDDLRDTEKSRYFAKLSSVVVFSCNKTMCSCIKLTSTLVLQLFASPIQVAYDYIKRLHSAFFSLKTLIFCTKNTKLVNSVFANN